MAPVVPNFGTVVANLSKGWHHRCQTFLWVCWAHIIDRFTSKSQFGNQFIFCDLWAPSVLKPQQESKRYIYTPTPLQPSSDNRSVIRHIITTISVIILSHSLDDRIIGSSRSGGPQENRAILSEDRLTAHMLPHVASGRSTVWRRIRPQSTWTSKYLEIDATGPAKRFSAKNASIQTSPSLKFTLLSRTRL